MEERLDKLFKDKLVTHNINPSAQAWERINHQLLKTKRMIWRIRLSVAASILVFISAVAILYFYIIRVDYTMPTITSSETVENPDLQTEVKDNAENLTKGKYEPSAQLSTDLKSNVESSKNKDQTKTQIGNGKLSSPVNSNENLQAVKAIVKEEEILRIQVNPIPLESQEMFAEDMSIEQIEIEEPVQNQTFEAPTLTFEKSAEESIHPKIKIVYRADRNSELIASSNRTLIDKGIKKITKFSDEHLITEQVKTKLRNTKDDLLALNFGKIINKSNKEIDN